MMILPFLLVMDKYFLFLQWDFWIEFGSAFLFIFPGLYLISYSYSANFYLHLISREVGSAIEFNHTNGL